MRVWLKRTWSPTCRSPTAIGWPPLVMTVELVTEIVRVQPSSVASEICGPLIARIVIGPRALPLPLSPPLPLPWPSPRPMPLRLLSFFGPPS